MHRSNNTNLPQPVFENISSALDTKDKISASLVNKSWYEAFCKSNLIEKNKSLETQLKGKRSKLPPPRAIVLAVMLFTGGFYSAYMDKNPNKSVKNNFLIAYFPLALLCILCYAFKLKYDVYKLDKEKNEVIQRLTNSEYNISAVIQKQTTKNNHLATSSLNLHKD